MPLWIKRVLLTLLVAAPFVAHAGFDWKKMDVETFKGMAKKVKQAKGMNEQEEVQLGRDVAANLIGAAPLVKDPALQEYVNRIGKWLAMHTERPGLPWRFGVLETDGINAFATPGGIVLVTRGLLLRMRDESELAGVLAHEMSHVLEKHALNTMRKGAVAGLAGDLVGEYAKQRGKEGYNKLVNAGTEIYTRGLDKEDEYAADRMGVVIAARAGYDPYGLAGVLQTLASINPKDDAVALMFRTHPDPGKRLELLLAAMEGPLDRLGQQPKVSERFGRVMQTHTAGYIPLKKRR